MTTVPMRMIRLLRMNSAMKSLHADYVIVRYSLARDL